MIMNPLAAKILNATQRWRRNLPCKLSEMATALELKYHSVWQLSQEDGFPILQRRVVRSDFEAWRRRRVGVAAGSDIAGAARAAQPGDAR